MRIATAIGVAAAVAAAVLLNLSLLGNGSAQSDPVGRLSPKAQLPAAPPGVVRPRTGPVEHDAEDD
jgi:hypothetical protein